MRTALSWYRLSLAAVSQSWGSLISVAPDNIILLYIIPIRRQTLLSAGSSENQNTAFHRSCSARKEVTAWTQ